MKPMKPMKPMSPAAAATAQRWPTSAGPVSRSIAAMPAATADAAMTKTMKIPARSSARPYL